MYPVVHKIKNKDKETSKSKKNEQNYLNATWLEPTSFECLNAQLSTRLSGNCD